MVAQINGTTEVAEYTHYISAEGYNSPNKCLAQSAGAVEYTDCFSAEG